MGTVIRFPDEKRALWDRDDVNEASASIVILPVVRIERHAEAVSALIPGTKNAGGRGRRRPAQRS